MKRFILFILLIGLFTTLALAATPRVLLTWNANTEPDLANYRVYRDTGAGTSITLMVNVPTNTYTDLTPPSVSARYYVTAIDQSGNESLPSNFAYVDLTAPGAPKYVKARIER